MKILQITTLTLTAMLVIAGCTGPGGKKGKAQRKNDTISISDTGFTGVKKFYNGERLVKEVTFKNGVREGLTKSYYSDGRLRQTAWFVNNLKEDSVIWYYPEGQIYRTTPYKRDSIDGIQRQYFRNGRIKAKLEYIMGYRTPFFEEYTQDGKLIGNYPEITVTTSDNYASKGSYSIMLKLSNNSTKVKYYIGEFTNGIVDTANYKKVWTIKGIGRIDLKKTETQNKGYIEVIAEVLTRYSNNYLAYKKIELPYNDIN